MISQSQHHIMETTTKEIKLTEPQQLYAKRMLRPAVFRAFAFMKLPAAWVAGLKVTELTDAKGVTSVPFKWLNQNPFKSMYFAVQSMAAELSTGALVLLAAEGYKPSIATLIVDIGAEFPKKANGKVFFTCHDGHKAFAAVERCIETGEPEVVRMETTGEMADGTVVSKFHFTWSVKQRSK